MVARHQLQQLKCSNKFATVTKTVQDLHLKTNLKSDILT